MTLQDVLKVGSRLFKHLGGHQGRMAIYPRGGGRSWYLLVKHDRDLVLPVQPDEFDEIPVMYEIN